MPYYKLWSFRVLNSAMLVKRNDSMLRSQGKNINFSIVIAYAINVFKVDPPPYGGPRKIFNSELRFF